MYISKSPLILNAIRKFKIKTSKYKLGLLLVILLTLITNIGLSQNLTIDSLTTDKIFEQGLNWEEIQKKAQEENKYIFIDCFATWCAPCKKMDLNIYPNEKVKSQLKRNFISVKLQFDKTNNDNSYVRGWYNIADQFSSKYKIIGYPSFLFFSPKGELVHSEVGAKYNPEEFLKLLENALDSSKQYYKRLLEYQSGNRDATMMMNLARATAHSGDPLKAAQIATDYINSLTLSEQIELKNVLFISEFPKSPKTKEVISSYKNMILNSLEENRIMTKEHIALVSNYPYIINSKDIFFKLILTKGSTVDSIIGKKGLANVLINKIIIKEEITNKLYNGSLILTKKPNWKEIIRSISTKYGERYSNVLVPDAQLQFYKKINDWDEYIKLRDKMMETNPPQIGTATFASNGTWILNIDAWSIFLNSKNASHLKKALQWVEIAIKLESPNPNTQYLDTKANILYKLNYVKQAIELEQSAIDTEIANSIKAGHKDSGTLYVEYKNNLDKMKSGTPTWIENK